MKSLLFIFFAAFIHQVSFAQKVTVSNNKMNVVYVGVDNPISVTAENFKSSDIKVSTDNGELFGSNGLYIVRPHKEGRLNIVIEFPNKTERWSFRSLAIPSPKFKIGIGMDSIAFIELVNQQYVRADLEDFAFDVRFTVDSFAVTLITTDTCKIIRNDNTGNKISIQTNELFRKAKPGDLLLFDDIYASGPDGSVRLLPRIISVRRIQP